MKTPLSLRQVRRGFTLIELLLVIGIIAILASIVIVAINPTKQLGSARDAQRRSDVNTIVNGVYQYAIDKNTLPSLITTTNTAICKSKDSYPAGVTEGTLGTTCVKLDSLSGTYLVRIPSDPQAPTGTGFTGYSIVKDATTSRVTVTAKGEQTSVISVSR